MYRNLLCKNEQQYQYFGFDFLIIHYTKQIKYNTIQVRKKKHKTAYINKHIIARLI